MSTATQKAKMSSRHVLLIITGIMLTFGCSALTISTWTNFQPVVSEAMGMVTSTGAIDTAPFALYITVLYLTMTVVSPMAGKLIQKMDIRIILSVSAALVGIAFILMSIYTEIWQFYISGVLLGLGEISILWLAIPTLMNRWFKKSAGFFIGICMAMTGVGGAIWNSLFTALNSSGTSYQTIYLIWGIVALATSLPFTLFCIRSTPEEVGLQPYGAEIAEDGTVEKAKGLSASKAMKSPVFYAVFIYAGIINFLTIIAPQFPSYMRSLGAAGTVAYDVAVVGGVMSVAVMVAQAISKVAMGGFADKNAKVTMITAFVAGVAGGSVRDRSVRRCLHLRLLLCQRRGAVPHRGAPGVRHSRILRDLLSRVRVRQPHGRFRCHYLGVPRFEFRLRQRVHRRYRRPGGRAAVRSVRLRQAEERPGSVDRITVLAIA